MLREAMEYLAVKDNATYVDATLGGGGYSETILEANATAKVFGFDTDPAAQEFATKRLEKFGDRFILVGENFAKLRQALSDRSVSQIDGIVYDLGISSHQIDTASIGLSYRVEAPLDMRLDPRLPISAKNVIDDSDENELARIFREYGEERFAKLLAKKVIDARTVAPINTTTELAEAVTRGMREDKRSETLSRIFQALRIEVNGELESLKTSLEAALEVLKAEGRIVVVSYHSLEDRIVKEIFRRESSPATASGSLEALWKTVDTSRARLELLTKKPITPGEAEIEHNPRARSAKLRAAVRL